MKALVTGISGQDGSYLTEHLASLGYEVFGLDMVELPDSLRPYVTKFFLGHVADWWAVDEAVRYAKPDEIYNLAAELNIADSWERPADYIDSNIHGLLCVLESAREMVPQARIFQATSSDVFGRALPPQLEQTSFDPLNPYAVTKAAAHQLAQSYRLGHGMFVSCGILFPHSSPRQKGGVLRKIAQTAAEIRDGRGDVIRLGANTTRDWGHAQDYVKAMHLMLQQPSASDYCIGTGIARTVADAAREALDIVGMYSPSRVALGADILRPTDAPALVAYPWRIRSKGWMPEITFRTLMGQLIEAQLAIAA